MGAPTNYRNGFYQDYEKRFQKNEKLAGALRAAKYNDGLALKPIATLQNREQDVLRQNAVLSCRAEAREKEGARLQGLLNRDSTHSGIPTSMTARDKNKVIPNSRIKTGKTIGGQGGHARHKLETFRDEEVNARAEHPLEHCPHCPCGNREDTGERIEKDERDYQVTVEKRRHIFRVYPCPYCGKDTPAEIPVELKEDNQYGPQV